MFNAKVASMICHTFKNKDLNKRYLFWYQSEVEAAQ